VVRNSCGIFSGAVLGGAVLRQFYAGGKISACCLVGAILFIFISSSSVNDMCYGDLSLTELL